MDVGGEGGDVGGEGGDVNGEGGDVNGEGGDVGGEGGDVGEDLGEVGPGLGAEVGVGLSLGDAPDLLLMAFFTATSKRLFAKKYL